MGRPTEIKYLRFAVERAATMLRALAEKASSPEDPYGGLMLAEDADLLDETAALLATPQHKGPITGLTYDELKGMVDGEFLESCRALWESMCEDPASRARAFVPAETAPPADPDGERYRWLFDDAHMQAIVDAYEAGCAPTESSHTDVLEMVIGFHVSKSQVDAAIDAAMAKEVPF